MGVGGVKNCQNHSCVINEWFLYTLKPLCTLHQITITDIFYWKVIVVDHLELNCELQQGRSWCRCLHQEERSTGQGI